jgi:uncharacterized protein YkwD
MSAPTPASTPPAATTTSAGTRAPDLEGEVLALINTARSSAGCGLLVADAGLTDLAQAHSADMRDRGFFDHENPDDLDESDRAEAAGQTHARAENIAQGQQNAAAVMAAWMDKSGHRANILDCDLRTLGVGIADGPDDRWWTLVFGD